MNILTSYKFQVKSHIRPMIVFFSIIAALDLLTIVTALLETDTENDMVFGGQEFAALIFMFVMGISIFTENFHMLIQNGISRKSMYIGRLATVITVSAVFTIVHLIIDKLFQIITITNSQFMATSISEIFYKNYYADAGFATKIFTEFVWLFSFFVALTSVGYFISTLMYRLSKYGKLLFWGSMWAVLMLVLPFLDFMFFNGELFNILFNFVPVVTGVSCGNPFIMSVSCGVVFAVFSAITWIILCRLPVKK